jgi:hypothetical protein
MKARIIYLATLMMAMFAMSACSNEEELSDVMDEDNLLSERVEIFEIDSKNTTVECPQDKNHTVSLFSCFEDEGELDGLYSFDGKELLNWNNRTLVVVHIFYPSKLVNFTTKIYKKDNKYVIEILEKDCSGVRLTALDHRCFGILLDESDVKKEDIQLKVGIQCLDEKGEVYHKFI